jgi:hypothetical protein
VYRVSFVVVTAVLTSMVVVVVGPDPPRSGAFLGTPPTVSTPPERQVNSR